MRKRIFGRRFKRDTNERKALFRGLMSSLVIYGKIRTTSAKAKAIKGDMEKLVTHAKKGEEARRLLMSRIPNDKIIDRLILEIAPKFSDRPGGYTRILKYGPRVKDGADMVVLTWVEVFSPLVNNVEKRSDNKKKASVKSEKSEAKKEVKKTTSKTDKKSLKGKK